jgi:ubiquitin carboxyl-terminal hydrolase L3
MVSRPVKAIILLFPLSETLKSKRTEEEAKIATEGQADIDPSIIWIKQTVRPAAVQ